MGFKARPKQERPDAPLLHEVSEVRDFAEMQEGVDTYAPALIDYLVDYELEPEDVFGSDELQLFDPEDQAMIHFAVGYIACAGALFDVDPSVIVNNYIKG